MLKYGEFKKNIFLNFEHKIILRTFLCINLYNIELKNFSEKITSVTIFSNFFFARYMKKFMKWIDFDKPSSRLLSTSTFKNWFFIAFCFASCFVLALFEMDNFGEIFIIFITTKFVFYILSFILVQMYKIFQALSVFLILSNILKTSAEIICENDNEDNHYICKNEDNLILECSENLTSSYKELVNRNLNLDRNFCSIKILVRNLRVAVLLCLIA